MDGNNITKIKSWIYDSGAILIYDSIAHGCHQFNYDSIHTVTLVEHGDSNYVIEFYKGSELLHTLYNPTKEDFNNALTKYNFK